MSIKNQIILFLASTVVALAVIYIVFIRSVNINNMPISKQAIAVTDNGIAITLEQDLFIEADIDMGREERITKYYFDGLRLYVIVESDRINNLLFSKFTLSTQDGSVSRVADEMYQLDKSELVVIWNDSKIDRDLLYRLSAKQKTQETLFSDTFTIQPLVTSQIQVDKDYGDIHINSITMADTSVLIDFNYDSLKSVGSFQIDEEKVVASGRIISSNEKNCQIIFPVNVDSKSSFTLYLNDQNGYIMSTIPVDLSK